MCHKAYALDHASFLADLGPVLYDALVTGRDAELAKFIDANLPKLSLPWEARPLPTDWRSVLEHGHVHELGDLALTKYYDADDDCGLQEHWLAVEGGLPQAARACLLGDPFGPPGNQFDPGHMGSYFQSPGLSAHSRDLLASRVEPELEPFVGLLEEIVRSGKGLYVTF
jgi:hypothetical protein